MSNILYTTKRDASQNNILSVFYVQAILCLLCLSCSKPYQVEKGEIFNTYYIITYESPIPLTDKIKKELQDCDLSFNAFNQNSIISKVNRNEAVEVNEKFSIVFNKAMEVSEKSGGAFDVTVAPLINLWGFGFEKSDSVSQQTIDSIKAFVGYKKIRLSNKKIIKDDPRIKLNFSAIAKGYTCDVIGEIFEREGVKNYLVDIGGEDKAKGKNAKGLCWSIGINKPENDVTGVKKNIDEFAVRLCGTKGLATSGDYRNYYMKDGKKYAHTIDPRTGHPAGQNILSATIVAPDCMTADAYATAFMVMGIEAACQMAETIPEIDYFILYPSDSPLYPYQRKYSEGMKVMLIVK